MKQPKFTFEIINDNLHEYDAKGNEIHYKKPDGYEYWQEYDAQGNQTHYKSSNGYEFWQEYDAQGKEIHYKDSNGYEYWHEYDAQGKEIHYKDSDGDESWYDAQGNRINKAEFDAIHAPKPSCAGKVVEIDGKKYKLVEA